MTKFKYSGYTREDAERTKNDRKSNFDSFIIPDITFFKASEGSNNIRILPPTFDNESRRLFGLKVFLHYNIGVDKSAYLCPAKMQNSKCPICDERAKLDPDTDEEYIRSLNYSGKILIYVLDRNSPDKGPLVWTIPNTVLDDILDDSEDEATGELLNIDHPEKGYDVSFMAVDAGKRTCKYKKVRVSRKATPLAVEDADFDDVMDFIEKYPLSEILNYYSTSHIAAKFGAEETESENTTSKRSGSRRTEEEPTKEDDSPRRSSRRTVEEPAKEDVKPKRSSKKTQVEDVSEDNNDDTDGNTKEDSLPFTPDPEKKPEKTETGSRLSRFRRNRTA